MRNDYAEDVAKTIIELLKKGTAPWQKPWEESMSAGAAAPINPVSGNAYQGMNSIWLRSVQQARGYDDNRWMTYRQATGIGAQVRRGEKATGIEFWKWDDVRPVTDATGYPVRDGEGREVMERVRLDRPIRKVAAVFNGAQIDGLTPLPPRELRPEPERLAKAEKILDNSGAVIIHRPGDRAFYSATTDKITLPAREQFRTPTAYYGTALHELGHWTGHESRLNRDIKNPYGSKEYAKEELRAELSSLMVADQTDIPYDPEQNAAYVGSWISILEDKPNELFKAAVDAQKIANYVMAYEKTRSAEAEADDTIRRRPDQSNPSLSVRLPKGGAQEATETMAVKTPTDEPRQEQSDRRYITVPYGEKDEAKKLGAKWDKPAKSWYIPEGVDAAPFEKWGGKTTERTGSPTTDPIDGFKAALADAGLQIAGEPIMDGAIHRVQVEGDRKNERSGAYTGHLDGRPAGFIQNFRTGLKTTWKADQAQPGVDEAALAAQAAARRAEREAELRQQYEAAAVDAKRQIETATPAVAHQYLEAKGIEAHGTLIDEKARLVVPITNLDDKLQSIQTIAADGTKGFMKDGKMGGGMFKIGDFADESKPVIVAEGFATGATMAEATGYPVAVAFMAGNLPPVAEAIRERYPTREIIIAGDNDWRREEAGKPNVGAIKAQEAAEKVKGFAVLAPRDDRRNESDWNDYSRRYGKEMTADRFQIERRAAHHDNAQSIRHDRATEAGQITWEQHSTDWQKGADAQEAERTESFEAAESEGVGID